MECFFQARGYTLDLLDLSAVLRNGDATRIAEALRVCGASKKALVTDVGSDPFEEDLTAQEKQHVSRIHRHDEDFDRFREPNGDDWIVVDSILRDPQYLTQPYLRSVAFKKIPDGQGWDPTPCSADQPR